MNTAKVTKPLRERFSLGVSSQSSNRKQDSAKTEVGLSGKLAGLTTPSGAGKCGFASERAFGAVRPSAPAAPPLVCSAQPLNPADCTCSRGKGIGEGAPGVQRRLSGPPGNGVSLSGAQRDRGPRQAFRLHRKRQHALYSQNRTPRFSGSDPRSSSCPGCKPVELATEGHLGNSMLRGHRDRRTTERL